MKTKVNIEKRRESLEREARALADKANSGDKDAMVRRERVMAELKALDWVLSK